MNEQERPQAIDNTRKWVMDQPWYRSRGQRAYVPSAEGIHAYEEKHKVKYKGPRLEESEELAAREKPEMEDPKF